MIEHISTRSFVFRGAEAPSDNKPAGLIVNLAEKLDIAGGNCACPKRDSDIPCRVASPPENAGAISIKLQKLQYLDASCPGLEAELQDLAKLLHCRYHSPQKWHVKRAEHWMRQGIFRRQGQLSPPLSISDQLRSLSKLSSVQCSGKVVTGERCKRRVGGRKVQNAAMTVLALSDPEVYLDEAVWHYAVEVLVLTLFCASHVEQRWNTSIDLRQRIRDLLESSLNAVIAPKGGEPSVEASKLVQAYRTGVPPGKCWPIAFNNKAFITEISSRRPASREDCYKELRRVVISRLSSTEQRDGFVYLYQADNNDPYVKIGYTGKDAVQERIVEWEFDCNRNSRLIYPDGKALTERIPNAKRIEALCHAELAYVQELWECQACTVTHMEWFRMPADLAIRVIQKWTIWMRSKPYQNEYLASDLYSSTRNMPTFMDSLSAAHEAAELPAVEVTPLIKEPNDKLDAKVASAILDLALERNTNTVTQESEEVKQEPVDDTVDRHTSSRDVEGSPVKSSIKLEDDSDSTLAAKDSDFEAVIKAEDEEVRICQVPTEITVDKKSTQSDPPSNRVKTAA